MHWKWNFYIGVFLEKVWEMFIITLSLFILTIHETNGNFAMNTTQKWNIYETHLRKPRFWKL